jgi:hypothetical protein
MELEPRDLGEWKRRRRESICVKGATRIWLSHDSKEDKATSTRWEIDTGLGKHAVVRWLKASND